MQIIYNPDFDIYEVHGPAGIEYADRDYQKCITYRMAVEAAQ